MKIKEMVDKGFNVLIGVIWLSVLVAGLFAGYYHPEILDLDRSDPYSIKVDLPPEVVVDDIYDGQKVQLVVNGRQMVAELSINQGLMKAETLPQPVEPGLLIAPWPA